MAKDLKKSILNRLEEKTCLSGCGCKMGEEVDGWEFEVETLKEFVEILNTYGSIHLNFFGDDNIDLWIERRND